MRNNRFFHWWLDLLGSVLLTPLVLGMAIALSLTLASHVVSARSLSAHCLPWSILCGGLWFAGKMVHQLTWRGFSHGSALAGFRGGGRHDGCAGASLVVRRLHGRGTWRESRRWELGRELHEAASDLRAQGLTPAAGGLAGASCSGTFGVAWSHGADLARNWWSARTWPRRSDPTGRPPSPERRTCFRSTAFNAFGAAHDKLIGASTRDQPYGSVSSGDRAKARVEPDVAAQSGCLCE